MDTYLIKLSTMFGVKAISVLAVDDDDAVALASCAVKMRLGTVVLNEFVDISRADGTHLSAFKAENLAAMTVEPR